MFALVELMLSLHSQSSPCWNGDQDWAASDRLHLSPQTNHSGNCPHSHFHAMKTPWGGIFRPNIFMDNLNSLSCKFVEGIFF